LVLLRMIERPRRVCAGASLFVLPKQLDPLGRQRVEHDVEPRPVGEHNKQRAADVASSQQRLYERYLTARLHRAEYQLHKE